MPINKAQKRRQQKVPMDNFINHLENQHNSSLFQRLLLFSLKLLFVFIFYLRGIFSCP
jgi:hypothetical protein